MQLEDAVAVRLFGRFVVPVADHRVHVAVTVGGGPRAALPDAAAFAHARHRDAAVVVHPAARRGRPWLEPAGSVGLIADQQRRGPGVLRRDDDHFLRVAQPGRRPRLGFVLIAPAYDKSAAR